VNNPPSGILDSIRIKTAVVFIGSGFSTAAGFPSSQSIAAYLSRVLEQDGRRLAANHWSQLDRVAELFEATYGRGRLVSAVESFLRTSPREILSPSHRLLASLVKHGFVKTIVTTNYDTLIEDACAVLGVTISVVSHASQLHAASGEQPVLYKIHGDFSHPDLLVLTPADFQRWGQRPEVSPIVTQLKALLDRSALIFLGYSLSDFNILALLLGSDFSLSGSPRHKRFAAVFSEDESGEIADRLRQYAVEGFPCRDIEKLLRWIMQRLPVTLRVKHLIFNYPSWYPDQEARYGGIETFIQYLKEHSKTCTHTEYSALFGSMLKFERSRTGDTSQPTYPASFFFFRAAAKAALEMTLSTYDRESLPDVIHVHFLDFAPLPEELGIPTLCTSHSLLSLDLAFTKGLFDGSETPGAKQEVFEAYSSEKAAASAAHFVTVLSAAHEREVRSLGARSVRRLDTPFNAWQYRQEDPESARSRAWPPIKQKFTITYVGRPDRRKGIEVLIGACERLGEAGADFQLVLVGYGFYVVEDRLQFGTGWYSFDISALQKRGIHIELRRANHSREAGIYYSASDVVVIPSLYEPMGYVALEAMACSRPVVAADIGGLVETITDGSNGFLFAAGDADALAEKLLILYREPETRRRLGQQARKDVEGRRKVWEIVREWEELYQQAAFAFGEPLFPSPAMMDLIRERSERAVSGMLEVDVYRAAVIGCEIARRLKIEDPNELTLPEGVPVDRALLNAIATELQKALRRKGIGAPFSIAGLRDVMNDLALALLNREDDQPNLLLRAEETKRQMGQPWFEGLLGK
jgi:glycosyltransferase involved in cell wall biosynthesis